MKEGYVVSKSIASADDLKKINKLTRREMSADELYTFSVLLCDNDIDRDFEKFSVESLYQMAELFIGKTGIFDHNMSADNQSARIYDCHVEADQSKKTADGEVYHKLLAKAYMPKTEKNADLITEIESGIKKEVSVGCSVKNIVCSVCHEDMRTHRCEHLKGKEYQKGGKPVVAHAVLDGISDVYEWSFVAVPAQRNAGVVKNFKLSSQTNKFFNCEVAGEEITLLKSEEEKINRIIDDYKLKCNEIDECKFELKREINLLLSDNDESIVKAFSVAADKMNISELIEVKNQLSAKSANDAQAKLQLGASKKSNKIKPKNQGFII